VFNVSRWAGIFLAASGENAKEAFLCLKALVVPIKSVKGVFFGANAAEKLEAVLRESSIVYNDIVCNDDEQPSASVEYAIRFLCLLVEKNGFKYIDSILPRIESLLNKKNGILDITVESAAPLDDDFSKELVQMIKEKTGTADVNMKTCIKPELLGGYFLRTDGFYIDATLKGQAEKMMTYVGGLTFLRGGSNGKL
jgi:ATP synthase F1 delta subunit